MVGTALAIAGLASGIGGAIKAHKQASAANKAAQAQVDATNKASDYMRQGMGQLGQLYSPYVNTGAGAMGTIGRLITPGAGARYASPGPPNTMPMMPPAGMAPNQAVPRGGTFGQMAPQGYMPMQPPQRAY